jgi:hypothetical protein
VSTVRRRLAESDHKGFVVSATESFRRKRSGAAGEHLAVGREAEPQISERTTSVLDLGNFW